MDAFLQPSVSYRLITTIMWQRKKDMEKIEKIKKKCSQKEC